MINEQLYPGSTARYNNAAAFITARYMDYDALSLLQDYSIIPMPSAIGYRLEMDGPYDSQAAGAAAIFAGAVGTG